MPKGHICRLLHVGILVLSVSKIAAAEQDATRDCANNLLEPGTRIVACEKALGNSREVVEHALSLINLAQSRRLILDFDGAVADLEEAQALVPEFNPIVWAALLLERAEQNRVRGNPDAAFSDIVNAGRLTPHAAAPLISQSLFFLEKGYNERALKLIQRAMKLEPEDADVLYYAMRQSQARNDNQGCVVYADRAIKNTPNDFRAIAMRARCLSAIGRTSDASADLDKLEQANPWMAIAYEDMTIAYLRLSQPEKAAEAAHKAIRIDPYLENVYFDLITALMAMGDQQQAIATFRSFQKVGIEDTVGVANNLAWELYLAEQYKSAHQIVEEWVEANPQPVDKPNNTANSEGYPRVLDTLAHSLAAINRAEEAVKTFVRATEISNSGGLRAQYLDRLRALGFARQGESFEAALLKCTSTGASCKLF